MRRFLALGLSLAIWASLSCGNPTLHLLGCPGAIREYDKRGCCLQTTDGCMPVEQEVDFCNQWVTWSITVGPGCEELAQDFVECFIEEPNCEECGLRIGPLVRMCSSK